MADIIHRLGIKAQIGDVYKVISTIDGLSRWWTEETVGDSKIGEQISFSFKTKTGDLLGRMLMKVTALDHDKSVKWTVLEGPPDWIGSEITFDLSTQDGQVILLFGHRGWKESTESMAHCSMKWAIFLLSLKELVLTGKGKPSPNDVKIDNWN